MSDRTFIYGLCDPDTGELRYVGKADNPEKRVISHLTEAARGKNRSHRGNWLRSLLAQSKSPRLVVLLNVAKTEWQFWERDLIKFFRDAGANLVNETDGGDGVLDMTGVVRAKIRAGLKKKFETDPEYRLQMRLKNVGKTQSSETIERRAKKLRGKIRSEASRLKYAASKQGVKRAGSSQYVGVNWNKRLQKWCAVFNTRHLGVFECEESAARAYDKAAVEARGLEARVNFPKGETHVSS